MFFLEYVMKILYVPQGTFLTQFQIELRFGTGIEILEEEYGREEHPAIFFLKGAPDQVGIDTISKSNLCELHNNVGDHVGGFVATVRSIA